MDELERENLKATYNFTDEELDKALRVYADLQHATGGDSTSLYDFLQSFIPSPTIENAKRVLGLLDE